MRSESSYSTLMKAPISARKRIVLAHADPRRQVVAFHHLQDLFLYRLDLLNQLVSYLVDVDVIGEGVGRYLPGAENRRIQSASRAGRVNPGGFDFQQARDVVGVEVITRKHEVGPCSIGCQDVVLNSGM